MTARDLISELTALRVHPLTETNVERVEFTGSRLWTYGYDRDADQLDELRDQLAEVQAELKESEAEAGALRAELDRVSDEQTAAADIAAECNRFRQACTDWATHCQTLQAELSALRKRKGVEAGVAAHSREIWALLWHIAQTDGPHKTQAGDLARKISAGA